MKKNVRHGMFILSVFFSGLLFSSDGMASTTFVYCPPSTAVSFYPDLDYDHASRSMVQEGQYIVAVGSDGLIWVGYTRSTSSIAVPAVDHVYSTAKSMDHEERENQDLICTYGHGDQNIAIATRTGAAGINQYTFSEVDQGCSPESMCHFYGWT